MSNKNQRIVLFDGVCGLCNAWVDFILKRDSKGSFKFAPLQGEYANQVVPDHASELKSIVYICFGKEYTKSGAVLRILRDLGGVWRFAWIFWLIPFFVRDPLYLIIATNRYRFFGKRDTCRFPSEQERQRFIN